MSARELMAYIPDNGARSVGELARAVSMGEEEVRRLACGLQDSWLVKVDGDLVFATGTLQDERRAGLLPQYHAGAGYVQPPFRSAGSRLEGVEKRVFEYMSLLWDGTLDDLGRQFGMTGVELHSVLGSLQRKSLIRFKEKKKWGLSVKRNAAVSDDAEAAVVRMQYIPSSSTAGYVRKYRTEVDVFVSLVESFSPLSLTKAASHIKTQSEKLLPIAEILHGRGIIRLKHKGARSVLLSNDPGRRSLPSHVAGYSCATVEEYEIEKDGVRLEAALVEEEGEMKYRLSRPVFEPPTQAVMSRIYDDLTPGVGGQVNDSRDFEHIKAKLVSNIGKAVDERLPFVEPTVRRVMALELANQLHLGVIEYLLRDPYVEEIKAQDGRPVFIKHVRCPQEWVETNMVISDDELNRYAKAIARETAQQIDSSHPLMDAVLHTHDRVNVSLPEIAGGSTIIEIRVFSKSPWNFVRLIRKGTVNAEVIAFLWLALQHRLNILVAGEAGSGKTSFITALGVFLPKNDHIISVEDTRELQLPCFFRNWSHLTIRRGNVESNVTMSKLLINALRMNPSFILLGEVRGPEDIQALMRATAMGHPVMSTIHTRDCHTAIKRFMDAGVPANDLANIHLNVILEAVKPKKESSQPKRRVKEIGEYLVNSAGVDVNRIYHLDMNTDEIKLVNEPRRYFQRVMDKVSMNKDEVRQDILAKKTIIEWLVRQGTEDIEVLGRVIQFYYRDPGKVAQAAQTDMRVEELLENQNTP